MAAIIVRPSTSQMFKEPSAANVPAANNNESPGRKGVTTKPVSMKMTKNSSTYVHTPYCVMIFAIYSSRCKNKSIKNFSWSITLILFLLISRAKALRRFTPYGQPSQGFHYAFLGRRKLYLAFPIHFHAAQPVTQHKDKYAANG